jgi:ABC-type polysaccharide/polyol phosphate transport system ATPase subunit
MSFLDVDSVSKAFLIPAVRRDTIREHVLSGLTRRRYYRLQVLDSVSFTVRQGETLGIMGQNGSGKSTLLKIVCGIYQPDRGAVRVTAPITPILELGVGWNPELDALDNVELIGSVMGLGLSEIRASMEQILAFADVEQFANLKLKHYSSGMASRLAYAVAFEAVREVLVLDEVFAVGDAGFKARCEDRFRTLRSQGHTIILVSHDPKAIGTFCDRAILLGQGRVVVEGNPQLIAERYVSTLTQQVPEPTPA